ncbi:MAG: purine/pyrimidine permease [Methanospirillaceae archaeon]|nr:purine/pyrimidine permease [Methanospirillaceae archaeon]
MVQRPPELIYSVDEKPAPVPLFLLGVQHIFLIIISLILPVMVVKTIGGSDTEAMFMVSMGMLAAGICTCLQAYGKKGIGCGYLCPSLCGPSYISSSVLAAQAGGLHLLYGMTVIAGIFETFLSRLITRLRFMFPSEVTGTVVCFVAIAVMPIVFPKFLGIHEQTGVLDPLSLGLSILTLVLIIGLNVYSKGKAKLYCVLIGMIFGYIISFLTGILDYSHIEQILNAPILGFPDASHFGLSFDITLAAPFLIAMVCVTLKSVGDITTCQRINDLSWKRPDMKNIRDGIFVDGLGDIISGLLGTYGQSTSSGNIGLSIGTGATSRYIGYSIGAILIVLACFPKLAMIFVIMPDPVMAAAILYSMSFMLITGLNIISSRMMDVRRTFVVGLSFFMGLSVLMPGLYIGIPSALEPIFSSTLSMATLTVIILHLVLRIGIKETATLVVERQSNIAESIFYFMKVQGGVWGARPDVITHATSAIHQCVEMICMLNRDLKEVDVKVIFDEFNLDADISYLGSEIPLAEKRPSEEEIAEDESTLPELAGFMIRRLADKVSTTQKEETAHVLIHYDH